MIFNKSIIKYNLTGLYNPDGGPGGSVYRARDLGRVSGPPCQNSGLRPDLFCPKPTMVYFEKTVRGCTIL
jgi:hypothetical protein